MKVQPTEKGKAMELTEGERYVLAEAAITRAWTFQDAAKSLRMEAARESNKGNHHTAKVIGERADHNMERAEELYHLYRRLQEV